MPAGGKNTVDFSAFDNAVKQTPDKGVDFSAFDDAVKKKDGGKPSPTALPSNAPLSLSERINQTVDNPQKQTGFKSTPIFGERKTNIPAKDKAAAQQAKHNQEVADAYQPKDKIIAPNGIDLPVSYDWTTSPQLHNQVVDNLQASIDMGEITPQVVGVTSKLTGKSPDATAAYLQGDATTGNAFDRVDVLKKNATELTGIIQNANAQFGWNTNPDEVLGNADLTSKWLSKYLLTLQQSDPVQQKKDEIEAQGRDLDIETLNAIISDDQNLKDRVANYVTQLKELNPLIGAVKTHIATQAAKEGYAKGESEEQTANKIALLTNPVGYKNAQEALKKPFGFDRLSDQSNLSDIVGGLADEIGGDKTFKNQMLNSVMDEARYKLNESYKKNAEDQAAIAHLSNDPDMLNEAKLMYAKYDKDILNKLPSLQLAKMANEVSNDIATAAGQLKGTDTESYTVKLNGATQQDIVAIMQEKGWFTDPNKKALAMQIATHPEMVKDASYFGGAKDSFLQPFKDLGLSLLDVTDIRSFKDRMADKFKDELFPKEFADDETKSTFSVDFTDELGSWAKKDFKARHIVNGISNLAGLTVGNIITEGVAGEAGMTADAAKRLSAYVTFGIPSIDANLKDSYNFIDNDINRAAYVTLGTLINGEGGALLDLGKISRVPGLKEPFMALSKNLVEKNLSTEAKDELLNVAKNKYVDFVKKWGKVGATGAKNTAEGAATMAYFGFANQYNKLLNGDPNTKAEDLLPTAGNAFLDGVFTMIPFGFVRAIKETKNNPNSTYKEMINKLSVMPTAAEDILRMGSKSPEDFNYKMSVVNTARAAKNSLDATEQATGVNLNPDQRSVYVANKTIEAVLRDKAAKINDKGKREQLEAQADELAEQSTKTLDGLKFTPTLEPLYDLYDAEKRYNKALDDFNNSGGTDDRRLVEAKKNYERLQYKYFNDTKPAEEVKQPEEKTFTDFDKTLFHEGKLTPLGEEIKARIAKGENITVLTARENTPANVDFIAQTLGIPTENIKAGLDAKGKVEELTAHNGKKVFYDDNPDNVAEAQKTDARVINTGLTPEQQIVMDNAKDIKSQLYKNIIDSDPTGENADEILKAASDQWHDEGTREAAERDFPKPIIDAAKKLYPQESQESLANKLPKTAEELFVPHKDNPMFMGMGDNTEQSLKYIAEQAQNMNDGKPVTPENPQAYEQMVKSLGGDKELVDAAIAKYPKAEQPKVTEGSGGVVDNPALKDVESTTTSLKNINENKVDRLVSDKALFHGTTTGNEFDKFDVNKANSGIGHNDFFQGSNGVYLVDNKDAAKLFSRKANEKAEQNKHDKNLPIEDAIKIMKDAKSALENKEGEKVKDVYISPDARIKELKNYPTKEEAQNINNSGKFDGIRFKEKGLDNIIYLPKDFEGTDISGKTTFIFNTDVLKNKHEYLAEAYHKAKSDGSNPELVKAVEEALGIKSEQPNIKEQINEEPQVEVPKPTEEGGITDEGVNKESGAAKEAPQEVKYPEIKSNKDVKTAFEEVYKKVGHDDLAGILYNWNESELSEDGDKIKSYVGRDGRYSKGKEGGEQVGGKKGFIQWLLSDAPFDEKVYGKDIKNDKEWVGNIEKARKAITDIFPVKESVEKEAPKVKKENVFEELDKAAESKKSEREKERAMENAAADLGEDGKRALAINKNFEDIVKHLKENKKIEIKCP